MNKLLNFPYNHILVLGLAKSGTAAAATLLNNHKKVRINELSDQDDKTIKKLERMGADVIVGEHPLSVLDGIDLIIKNPGIPYTNPILEEAMKRDVPIVTEVELASHLVDDAIIGITGSNGKTTTTMLLGDILTESRLPAKVAGNIGIVATDIASTLKKDENMVVELSSFQLQGTIDFKPKIAVLLNIFEAHLDYHKTFENYKNAKCNIFKNQTDEDYLIYNADDPTVSEAVTRAESVTVPFSANRQLVDGAWATDEALYFKGEKIIALDDIRLVGKHNIENILAAVCAAKLLNASNEAIKNVLTKFNGVKHRLQYVDTIEDRHFYNDSKATNVLATEKALASFKQPVILLAGGLDRGNSFTDLIPSLHHVKAMVVFGQTAEKLKETAYEANISAVKEAKNVEDAVQIAYRISERNDVVLLSPACASWDQYRTFEERGDMFIQAVHTLK